MDNPNFEVSTITTYGAALLAQATEGNKVIFSGCEANSTVYALEQAKAIAAITGTRITDGIEVTDVTDARILVRATFEPSATTGGEANSLILFGRLSSQDENTRTPICVVSNSTPFYLPEHNQAAVTAFDCLFTVQYNISSPVVVEQTSALECSLAEFRQLKERVVTTHKVNDNATGDEQDVYGVKTFLDSARFKNSKLGDTQTATVDVDGLKVEHEYEMYGFSASFGEDIIIRNNNDNQTQFKAQGQVLNFGKYYNRPFFSLDCSGNSGTVFMGIAPKSSTGEYPVSIVDGTLAEGVYLAANYAKIGTLEVTSVKDIAPVADATYSLGSSLNRWESVYAKNVNVKETLSAEDAVIASVVVNEYFQCNSADAEFFALNVTAFTASSLTVTNSASFTNGICASIVAQAVARGGGVSVGTIQFVVIENYDGAISAGDTLPSSKLKVAIVSATNGNLAIQTADDGIPGTWKAVTYGGTVDGTGQTIFLLAIRTE